MPEPFKVKVKKNTMATPYPKLLQTQIYDNYKSETAAVFCYLSYSKDYYSKTHK